MVSCSAARTIALMRPPRRTGSLENQPGSPYFRQCILVSEFHFVPYHFNYPTKAEQICNKPVTIQRAASKLRVPCKFIVKQKFSVDIWIYATIVQCRNELETNKSRKSLLGVLSVIFRCSLPSPRLGGLEWRIWIEWKQEKTIGLRRVWHETGSEAPNSIN